jgi:hypothetical protein
MQSTRLQEKFGFAVFQYYYNRSQQAVLDGALRTLYDHTYGHNDIMLASRVIALFCKYGGSNLGGQTRLDLANLYCGGRLIIPFFGQKISIVFAVTWLPWTPH